MRAFARSASAPSGSASYVASGRRKSGGEQSNMASPNPLEEPARFFSTLISLDRFDKLEILPGGQPNCGDHLVRPGFAFARALWFMLLASAVCCGSSRPGFWMGSFRLKALTVLKEWSHPPGLNRRPADYEAILSLLSQSQNYHCGDRSDPGLSVSLVWPVPSAFIT